MATSLLALLDDITTVLDDIAVMTKVATKKTAGVLGDDLALNANQVSGVRADRELPVVWAVAKGSFVNKAILVPAALLISSFLPWAILPLMMVGGAYLCFEGFEKLAHRLLHSKADDAAHKAGIAEALRDPAVDLREVERDKIRGAIRTDFILSAEIIVLTLGTAAGKPFAVQLGVLAGIAVLMTVGVYGLVAGIVKLDDAGLYLSRGDGGTAMMRARHRLGALLLRAAPLLMKFLTIAGTAAMFLVGGGILAHAIEPLHHAIAEMLPADGIVATLGDMLAAGVVGIVAGALVLAVVKVIGRFRRSTTPSVEPR